MEASCNLTVSLTPSQAPEAPSVTQTAAHIGDPGTRRRRDKTMHAAACRPLREKAGAGRGAARRGWGAGGRQGPRPEEVGPARDARAGAAPLPAKFGRWRGRSGGHAALPGAWPTAQRVRPRLSSNAGTVGGPGSARSLEGGPTARPGEGRDPGLPLRGNSSVRAGPAPAGTGRAERGRRERGPGCGPAAPRVPPERRGRGRNPRGRGRRVCFQGDKSGDAPSAPGTAPA